MASASVQYLSIYLSKTPSCHLRCHSEFSAHPATFINQRLLMTKTQCQLEQHRLLHCKPLFDGFESWLSHKALCDLAFISLIQNVCFCNEAYQCLLMDVTWLQTDMWRRQWLLPQVTIEPSYYTTMATGTDHNWTSIPCIYVDSEIAGCANNWITDMTKCKLCSLVLIVHLSLIFAKKNSKIDLTKISLLL